MIEKLKIWGLPILSALIILNILQTCSVNRKLSNIEKSITQIEAGVSCETALTIVQIDSVIKNAEYLQLIAERDLDEKSISLTQVKENWKNSR